MLSLTETKAAAHPAFVAAAPDALNPIRPPLRRFCSGLPVRASCPIGNLTRWSLTGIIGLGVSTPGPQRTWSSNIIWILLNLNVVLFVAKFKFCMVFSASTTERESPPLENFSLCHTVTNYAGLTCFMLNRWSCIILSNRDLRLRCHWQVHSKSWRYHWPAIRRRVHSKVRTILSLEPGYLLDTYTAGTNWWEWSSLRFPFSFELI